MSKRVEVSGTKGEALVDGALDAMKSFSLLCKEWTLIGQETFCVLNEVHKSKLITRLSDLVCQTRELVDAATNQQVLDTEAVSEPKFKEVRAQAELSKMKAEKAIADAKLAQAEADRAKAHAERRKADGQYRSPGPVGERKDPRKEPKKGGFNDSMQKQIEEKVKVHNFP